MIRECGLRTSSCGAAAPNGQGLLLSAHSAGRCIPHGWGRSRGAGPRRGLRTACAGNRLTAPTLLGLSYGWHASGARASRHGRLAVRYQYHTLFLWTTGPPLPATCTPSVCNRHLALRLPGLLKTAPDTALSPLSRPCTPSVPSCPGTAASSPTSCGGWARRATGAGSGSRWTRGCRVGRGRGAGAGWAGRLARRGEEQGCSGPGQGAGGLRGERVGAWTSCRRPGGR